MPIRLLCSIVLIFQLSLSSYAQKNPSPTPPVKHKYYQGETTVATITEFHHSKTSHITSLNYLVNGITYFINYPIALTEGYNRGQRIYVRYNAFKPDENELLIERPFFKPGELPDTTEGIITYVGADYCYISYKNYDSNDSLNINVYSKTRYLSDGMLDTLRIQKGYTYKVLYNKSNLSDNNAEILFTHIIDSTKTGLHLGEFYTLMNMRSKKPEEAVLLINKCIVINPDNTSLYIYQRGQCYSDMHEYDKAKADFNTYIEMHPNDIRGYIRLADVYVKQKKYNEAAEILTKTPTNANVKNNHEYYYLWGVISYKTKEYQKALDYYTLAIEYNTSEINIAKYYYDRALTKDKLYGKSSGNSASDYETAVNYTEQTQESKINGDLTLSDVEHTIYHTITSEQSLVPYSSVSAHMQAHLVFTYTVKSNSTGPYQPVTYDHSKILNTSQHSYAYNIGLISYEIGFYNKFYGRAEFGLTVADGKGTPNNLRVSAGYNFRIPHKDGIIIRAEMGCTYLNRHYSFGNINIKNLDSAIILGRRYYPYSTSRTYTYDQIYISLKEDVFNLSPAISAWLFPFKSFVFRFNIGYTWTFVQQYKVEASGHTGTVTKSLNQFNGSFTTSNGQSPPLFNYKGVFVGIGVGVKIN